MLFRALLSYFYNALLASTVMPAKNDSDDMFGLQSYQVLVIDKSQFYRFALA